MEAEFSGGFSHSVRSRPMYVSQNVSGIMLRTRTRPFIARVLAVVAACAVPIGSQLVEKSVRAQSPIAEEEHRELEPAKVDAELALANFRMAGGVADWVESQDGHLLIRRFNRKEYRIPLSKLEILPQAKIVTLHGYDFGDEDVEVMSKWAHLEGLQLVYNKEVTNDAMKYVERLSNLKRFVSWDTPLTDEGMKRIAVVSTLEYLEISNSPITDASLQRLKGLSKLTGVTLDRTKVTQKGVDGLRESLPTCKILWYDED